MNLRTRLLAAAGIGLAASIGIGPLGAPAADAATTTRTASMVVAPVRGGLLREGRDAAVDVTVTNTGTAALPAGTLAFSLDQAPVASSTVLLSKIAHPDQVLLGLLLTRTSGEVAALEPRQSRTVRVRIPRTDLASVLTGESGSASGARLLYVRYTARTGAGVVHTTADSALVRIADGFDKRIGFGTVVPLTAPAGTTGLVDTASQEALSQPGGAWDSAVRAAAAMPGATIALDPAVIASVRLAGGAAPPGAVDLLERLKGLPNQVVRLPYADGDLTLERSAGASQPLGPTSFTGSALVGTGSGATPAPSQGAAAAEDPASGSVADLTAWRWSDQSIAWPVSGTANAADLRALGAAGDTVLLGTGEVRGAADLASGPLARIGATPVLLADATASSLLAKAAAGGTAGNAALAQLVGVLATAATTGETTALLAVPGRTAGTAGLERVLGLLAQQSWVEGRSLADLARQGSAPGVGLGKGSVAGGLTAAATPALAAETRVRVLASTMAAGSATVTGPARLALLGLLSAAWRGRDADWRRATQEVTASLDTTAGEVHLVKQSAGNAIGSDGRLKVFVRNGLDEAVKVVVHADTSNAHLQFPDDEVTITVPARATNYGELGYRSITNGRTDVTFTLTTVDGTPVGVPAGRRMTVQAGVDTIVAVVLLAALGLLLALGVRRNVRRRRAPRSAT